MKIPSVPGIWLLLCLAAATPAAAQTPKAESAPNDAEVREIRQRLDSLSRQIDQLEATSDAASGQQRMQENWLALQDYLGWMHGKWGSGPPWLLGTEATKDTAWLTCPALGGTGAPWLTPEATSPKQYAQQMRESLRHANEQASQLAQASDLQQRRRLAQELWHALYRDVQTMRGLGWMWGSSMKGGDTLGPGLWDATPGERASALPDPASPGAKLAADYCTQCHAAPAPTLHTREEWAGVLGRMHRNVERVPGIRAPERRADGRDPRLHAAARALTRAARSR